MNFYRYEKVIQSNMFAVFRSLAIYGILRDGHKSLRKCVEDPSYFLFLSQQFNSSITRGYLHLTSVIVSREKKARMRIEHAHW